MRGIRGATTVDSNEEWVILEATAELLEQMIEKNALVPEDLAAAWFTVTPDLDATFPARAAREMGWQYVPLMCAAEIPVQQGLPRCIRVLLLANTQLHQAGVQHVYLRQAVALRPDLEPETNSAEGGNCGAVSRLRKPVVSIDGPAGAGKSTIARLLARELGLMYVDTGAMYRALAWVAVSREVDVNDAQALLDLLQGLRMQVRPGRGRRGWARVLVNGEDVTRHLRRPEVEGVVSQVARHPEVRRELVQLQRCLAQPGGVVMDGRDIGTVVLPQADLKLFLTASLEERAKRRGGVKPGQERERGLRVRQAIQNRDRQDEERAEGPLRPAPDAVVLDTTNLAPEEVVQEAVRLFRERMIAP